MTPDDLTLLREFAARQSEPAFAALVERYVGLVHSAALRQTGDASLAEEITQAVFIILARKAVSLGPKTILPAWLYRTTRYTASNALKIQRRRQAREQEAYMQSTLNEANDTAAWKQIAPLLDDTMDQLSEGDRAAVVLRYFENRPWREVAAQMQTTEDAAQKRVGRALEKLRGLFHKRGVMLTASLIAGAVTANSVQAAPLTLTQTLTTVAISKGSIVPASTLTLVKGTMKLMTWLKIKTAIAVGIAVALTAGTAVVAIKATAQSAGGSSTVDDSAWDKMDTRILATLPPAFVLRPTHFTDGNSGSVYDNKKMVGRAISFEMLMSMAYGVQKQNIILPAEQPAGRYDLMLTDPNVTTSQLQAEIKNQLGYTAHHEPRESDVLYLELDHTGAPGLIVSLPTATSASSSSGGGGMSGGGVSRHSMKLSNSSMGEFVSNLQNYVDKPIFDHTSLTDKYNITLQYVVGQGKSQTAAITSALPNQLGLKLVPARETMDVLVVGK